MKLFILLFNFMFFSLLHTTEDKNIVVWNKLPLEIQKEVSKQTDIFLSLKNLFFQHSLETRVQNTNELYDTLFQLLKIMNFPHIACDKKCIILLDQTTTFFSLSDGKICIFNYLNNNHFSPSFSSPKKIHNGEIMALNKTVHHLVSFGTDLVLYLLDFNLEQKASFNIKKMFDDNEKFIDLFYINSFDLLLLESDRYYYYLDTNLNFITKLQVKVLEKLDVQKDHTLFTHPTIIQEFMFLQNGVPFNLLALLRGIELALATKVPFVISKKEEQECIKYFPYTLAQFIKNLIVIKKPD